MAFDYKQPGTVFPTRFGESETTGQAQVSLIHKCVSFWKTPGDAAVDIDRRFVFSPTKTRFMFNE